MKGYKKVDKVLYHQKLPFILKIIQIKLINEQYDTPLAKHSSINKVQKLISQKYYWPSLGKDVESYFKGYDIYSNLKIVGYKLYRNFQALLVTI